MRIPTSDILNFFLFNKKILSQKKEYPLSLAKSKSFNGIFLQFIYLKAPEES